MATVAPFHSKLEEIKVYHNDDQCTEGNNIEERNFEKGTGGKKLCEHCQRLQASRITQAKIRVKRG